MQALSSKQILRIDSLTMLKTLEPGHFVDRRMTTPELRHIFEIFGAFWQHSGNPKQPHVKLTSGKCSTGYINCRIPLSFANLKRVLSNEVWKLYKEVSGKHVDWVVSSSYAAIRLGDGVADFLNCRFTCLQKSPDGSQKWPGLDMDDGAHVLRVEDLNTTGGTIEAVMKGVRAGNPDTRFTFCEDIMLLVDRSKLKQIGGHPIRAVAHFDIDDFEPGDCPLCAKGSESLRPSKENWKRLKML